jgi:hypothetical protein
VSLLWIPNTLYISGNQRPLVPLLLLHSTSFFLMILFLYTTLLTRDDRHLLAHAMASDFTVAWQCSQREQLFFLWIKLHAPKHPIHIHIHIYGHSNRGLFLQRQQLLSSSQKTSQVSSSVARSSSLQHSAATASSSRFGLGPILRLLNLQLQRQRCSRLERF